MDAILNLNGDFDVGLFDQVVKLALSSDSEKKKEAEELLLRFKELPDSWTKTDYILKNSGLKQSKFLALQFLEENVKSRWALFSEETKVGLRNYILAMVVELSRSGVDIVLGKLNSIVVEMVKRDWPQKWPTFVPDLIKASQCTSMAMAGNALKILCEVNEHIFGGDGCTTGRRRILKAALQSEYGEVFQFILQILKYSETQELEPFLLEKCFEAFCSFCEHMPASFIFSTRIVEHILSHLNSAHSVEVLDCVLEIIAAGRRDPSVRGDVAVCQKIGVVHDELVSFFGIYLEKFEGEGKLSQLYSRLSVEEKAFVGRYSQAFASLYGIWLDQLELARALVGLKYFVEISKIDDSALFNIVFPTWSDIITVLYNEHPVRVPTTRPLRRKEFVGVLQAMLPVFIQNMPKPEEVFIRVNELGEVVKDKHVETAEIEFYRKMRSNLFNLSYLIEEHMKDHIVRRIEKNINVGSGGGELSKEYRDLNQTCWAVGALAGAFEEEKERKFFVLVVNNALTICELRSRREERAIVASNIMFIIGQYHRFLKYNSEFFFVVVMKLFEFMAESHEGIKEMACDNFSKVCEKCPNQFFQRKNGAYIFDLVLANLSSVTLNLDLYLQRSVIEGLLLVLKHGPKQDMGYIKTIYSILTDGTRLDPACIQNIHSIISDTRSLTATVHVVESYALGLRILPYAFLPFASLDAFILLYGECSKELSRPAGILKDSLAGLFAAAVEANSSPEFLDQINGAILPDFSRCPSVPLVTLAGAIAKVSPQNELATAQRIQMLIASIVVEAPQHLFRADENPDLSVALINFMGLLVSTHFAQFYPFFSVSPVYDQTVKAVLASLTGLTGISKAALEFLIAIFRACSDNNVFPFFNSFFLPTFENVLGLILDKDAKSTLALQIDLLMQLIACLDIIPPLNPTLANTPFLRSYISNLFSENFKNITPKNLEVFMEGFFRIKNKAMFKEHIEDFTVRIYEYGSDENIGIDIEILEERIAAPADF